MPEKIRIGVIGTASIAKKRMIPAILDSDKAEYVGVAIASSKEWDEPHTEEEYVSILENKKKKAEEFVELFGGKVFVGYEDLLMSEEIDAVYIPLPPSMHYEWTKKALEYGKHVLAEKPFTIKECETVELVNISRSKDLAVSENYGFCLHPQLIEMKRILDSGEIGEYRLMRAMFTFPHRDANDFRYSKRYGGGALLDAGGYVARAAEMFLGDTTEVVNSTLNYTEGHEVDMYGQAVLSNADGAIAQVAFGMDNVYRCDIEVFGSIGSVKSDRAFTAPGDYEVILKKQVGGENKEISIAPVEQFKIVLERFCNAIGNVTVSEDIRKELCLHSKILEQMW